MHRAISSAIAVVVSLSVVDSALAQLVQVAPGYVKAPFVRVYTYPDGGSYVRAPFVSVYSPGYRGYPAHPVPTHDECCQMSWQSLGNEVRQAATQLEKDLGQLAQGNNWTTELKTAEILALVPKDVDAPPPDEARQQLQAISSSYDEKSRAADFRDVSNLRSFQVLQVVLAEYASPPEQRLRGQLYAAAADLNRSLGRFDTGNTWKQYFTLNPGMALSPDNAEAPQHAGSEVELAEVLGRFDSVAQNEEYAKIARLPAFTTTRERLAAYLGQPQSPSTATPEELPKPQPSDPQ